MAIPSSAAILFTLVFVAFATFQLLLWSHLDAVDHTPRALRPVRAWLRASRTEPPRTAESQSAALQRTVSLALLVEPSRAAAALAATHAREYEGEQSTGCPVASSGCSGWPDHETQGA